MPTVTAAAAPTAATAALHNQSNRMNNLSNDAGNNHMKEENAALQAILSLNKSTDDSLDGIFLNSTSPTNSSLNASSNNKNDFKGSNPKKDVTNSSGSGSGGNLGKATATANNPTTTTTTKHKSQSTLVSVISKDSSSSGSSVSGSTTITTTTSSTSASTNMSLSTTTSAANKRKHGSAFSATATSSSSTANASSGSSSSSVSVGTNGNASLSSYRQPPPHPHGAPAYGHPSMHPPPPHAYYAHPYAPPPPHPASYPNHYHMHYGHPYYPAPNAYHAYPPTAQPPPPPHPSYGYTSQGTVHSYGVAPPPNATVMNASTGAAAAIPAFSHVSLEKDAKKKSSMSSSSTSTKVVTAVKSSNHVKSSSTSSHKESTYSNNTHHGSNTNAVSIGSTTTASSSSTSSHVRHDGNNIKNIKKKNAADGDMNLKAPRCTSTTTFNTSPIASLNVIKASIGSSTKDSSSNNDKTNNKKDSEERLTMNGPHYKLNDSADTSSSSINLDLNGTFTPLPMPGGGKKSSSKSHSSSSRGHSSLLSPNFQILEGCLSWSVGNPSTGGSASSTGRSMLSSIDRRDDMSLGALTSSSKKKKSRSSGSDGSRESWRHTFSPYAQAACHSNAAQNSPMVGSRGVLNTSTESENTTKSEPKELTSKTPMAVKKPIKTQPKVATTPGYSPYYNAMATPGSNLFSPHPSSFPFSPYLFTPGAPPLPAVSESSNGNERVRNLRGNISFSRSVPYPNAMASPLVAPAFPYSSNNAMHSRNGAKSYALKHPLPNKFEGDIERNSSRTPPDFSNLVNFPPSAATSSGLGRNSGDNSGATISKICVMCGKMCPVSQGKKSRASLQHKAQQQAANTGASHLQPTPIIPSQNKGLCTSCDVNVWVVMDSACSRHPDLLQIKWCKGCKNFRPWASFGEKGLATKCVRCRDRQREKYALQKKEKEVSKVLSRAQQQHCS